MLTLWEQHPILFGFLLGLGILGLLAVHLVLTEQEKQEAEPMTDKCSRCIGEQ